MNIPKRIENLGTPIELASKFKPGDIVLVTNKYKDEDSGSKYYIGTISNPISPYSYRINITHGRAKENYGEELSWIRDKDRPSCTVDEHYLSIIEDFSNHEAYNTIIVGEVGLEYPLGN